MKEEIENIKIPSIKLIKPIGKGAMADVYLGVQSKLKRKVAVKILKKEKAEQEFIKRFLKEGQIVADLKHPNIVTIYDVGTTQEGRKYMVMEFLEETLSEKIKKHQGVGFNPEYTLKILENLGAALTYAHEKGVLHRDVKPDNILFRREDPVLVDFGIARKIAEANNLTSMGLVLGTPYYMSPEQCQGQKLESASDFYSLGIILYEMLTGNVPFKGGNATSILMKHINDCQPNLPYNLIKYQPLLDALLVKNLNKRIKNYNELKRAIDNLFDRDDVLTLKEDEKKEWSFENKTHNSSETQTIIPIENENKRRKSYFIIISIFLIVFVTTAIYFIIINQKKQIELKKQIEKAKIIKQEKEREKNNLAQWQNLINNATKLIESKNYNDALTQISLAKEIRKDSLNNKLEEQIKMSLKTEEEEKAEDILKEAQKLLKKGSLEKALLVCKEAKEITQNEEINKTEKEIIKAIDEKQKKLQRINRIMHADEAAYKKAMSINNTYAFEKYLKTFPKGKYSKELKLKIEELNKTILLEEKIKDDVAFEKAKTNNSLKDYNEYLNKFPLGKHREEAKIEINKIKNKIINSNEVKIVVKDLIFFSSSGISGDVNSYKYASTFYQKELKYINIKLLFENKLYCVINGEIDIKIIIHNKQDFNQTIDTRIILKESLKTGQYIRGIGWKESGHWPIGKYNVKIFTKDKLLFENNFEVL